MRIGFFTDSYYPAKDGVAVSVETFRQKLEEAGHQVYVFCPEPEAGYAPMPERVMTFPSRSSWWFDGGRESWPINPKTYTAIKKLKLDVIHTHTQFQIGLLGTYIAKQSHIPLVTTCHTDFEAYVEIYRRFLPALFLLNMAIPIISKDPMSLRSGISSFQPQKSITAWNKKLVRQIIKQYSGQCQLVVSPSEKVKDMLLGMGIKTPIEVVHTGVDATLFQNIEPFMRKKYGLQDKKIVLYAGRVRPEKNIELILESFVRIYQKFPDTVLMIVGPGAHQEELQDYSRQLGIDNHVIFTGGVTRDQVLAAMKESDIFAFASATETQGIVVDEAVLAGLPLVMVDKTVSGVAIEGENALFSESSAQEFAENLALMLRDDQLRERFAKNSQRISQSFDSSVQANKLEHAYQAILDTWKAV